MSPKKSNPMSRSKIATPHVATLVERRLLNLIRLWQPTTRAELSQLTGLPLSTIAFNTNRLLKSGWVYQASIGVPSGGRPARHLHVNGEKMYLVGIDIGVENTELAIADYNAHILFRQQYPASRDFDDFIRKLGARIRELLDGDYHGHNVECIGVSIPGLVDSVTGMLVRAPNLGWTNVPVKEWLSQATGLPVLVDNDANTAALAEMWQGRIFRDGLKNLLYILVVDGLGSTLVVDGRIYRGSRIGTGGFGHMCIDPDGPPCSCGGRGCAEVYVSNRAILRDYLGRVSGRRGSLRVADLITLAQRGDPRAQEVLLAAADKLSIMLRNLVHGLSPQAVIVGGELAGAWSLIEPVLSANLKSNFIVPEMADIRVMPAVVRDRPSLTGAIMLGIFQEMFADAGERTEFVRRSSAGESETEDDDS